MNGDIEDNDDISDSVELESMLIAVRRVKMMMMLQGSVVGRRTLLILLMISWMLRLMLML